MSANLKPIPEIEQPELSDDEAVAAIGEALEAVDGKKAAPAKPETPEDGTGEEGEEQPELVTLPGGEQVAIDDLPSKMVFEVPDGEDGEVREVSGSTVIKEGLRALEGKTNYERETATLRDSVEGLIPFVSVIARLKNDPGFAQHVRSYQAGIKHHDVDPELRFDDGQLMQIMQTDPQRAQRILAKRHEWLQRETARQNADRQTQQDQQRIFQSTAAYYEQIAEQEIDSRHGKGSFRNDAPGVYSYLNQMGLSPQDIQGIIDPRLQSIAYDAYKYNQLHSQHANIRQSLAGKRKKLKPAKAMTGGTGAGASSRTSTAKSYQKAIRTQKMDDWAAALAGRFKLD